MSSVCNKIAALDDRQLELKGAAARAATTAIFDAFSDCYKAAEALHAARAIGPESVYLHSASAKLDGALSALARNREILASVAPRAEALEWLRNLDYDRLYNDGVRSLVIPTNDLQWRRLAKISRAEGYIGVADGLMAGVRELQRAIGAVMGSLGDSSEVPTEAVPVELTSLLARIADFAALAQMVAYLNRLTPLDPAWTQVLQDQSVGSATS